MSEIIEGVRKEITIDTDGINIKLLIFAIPVFILFVLPYSLLWNNNIYEGFIDIIIGHIFETILFLLFGIIAHELIHGIVWSFFIKNGFKSISFGVIWSSFSPYCHCKELMKLKHYRLGGIMPAVLLGFIPAIISIFTGSIALLAFGIIFSIGAGGDLLMIWMLRKEKSSDWVQDHPDKIGCFIMNEQAEKD